jgi:hypothetical protein
MIKTKSTYKTNDPLPLEKYIRGDQTCSVYSNELEVKDTTDTQKSASYLNNYLEIDNGGRLKTNLYDKRDGFTFPILLIH